jgi:hypothetical protein
MPFDDRDYSQNLPSLVCMNSAKFLEDHQCQQRRRAYGEFSNVIEFVESYDYVTCTREGVLPSSKEEV